MKQTVNIWAFHKDISIKHLLLLLAERFKQGCYEIIDNPLDDERSIRIANSSKMGVQLYIYTYGQAEGCYGLHIEYPDLQETNYRNTIEIYENIPFEQLQTIIITELDIAVENISAPRLF